MRLAAGSLATSRLKCSVNDVLSVRSTRANSSVLFIRGAITLRRAEMVSGDALAHVPYGAIQTWILWVQNLMTYRRRRILKLICRFILQPGNRTILPAALWLIGRLPKHHSRLSLPTEAEMPKIIRVAQKLLASIFLRWGFKFSNSRKWHKNAR